MCLLFVTHPGHQVPWDKFKEAWSTNRDGYGQMFADGDQVIVQKTQTSVEDAWKLYVAAPADRIVVGHFRFGTSGKKDAANVHPFPVQDDLWMAHNGVLPIARDKNEDMSDTWHFVELLKQHVLSYEDLLKSEIQEGINEAIKGDNKLCFLGKDGRAIIFNKQAGATIENVWYSNTYSITPGRSYGAWQGSWDNDFNGYWRNGVYVPGGAYCSTADRIETKALTTRAVRTLHGRKKDPHHYRGKGAGSDYAKWWAKQNLTKTSSKMTLSDLSSLNRAEIKRWVDKNRWEAADAIFDLIHHQ